jgi:hypothetical protein
MMGWLDTYSEQKVSEAISTNFKNVLRQKTADDMSLALLRIAPIREPISE